MLFVDAAKLLLIETPEIPDALAAEMLRRAAIVFCTRSLAHRATLPRFDLVAGQSTYALSPPTDTEIVEIIRLVNVPANQQIEKRTEEQLMWGDAAYLSGTSGQPEVFTYEPGSNELALYPEPSSSAVAAMQARVALRPIAAAAQIDDQVWNRWSDALLDGARFNLYRIPGKPWSNGEAARLAFEQFDLAISQAHVEAANGGPMSPRRRSR